MQEKLEKGFLFYCVSRTARHTQNVRKNEREDKKVEVVVADKKSFSKSSKHGLVRNLGPRKVMYRSKVAPEATGLQYRIQNFLNFYYFLKTAFSEIFHAQNVKHKINIHHLLILNFLNLYFYFYFSFKKGLLLLFQSFDLKNQEGKDYIFQEQMVDIFLQQAIQSSDEAVVWAHGSSISLLMDL